MTLNKTTKEYLRQYREALLARHCLAATIGKDPLEARNRVWAAENNLRHSVKAGSKTDQALTREIFRLHKHVSSLSPQQALEELYNN